MSIHVSSLVWRTELGGVTIKSVAKKLADHASDDGTGIHPSIARIARETELSERSVQRSIKELLEIGLLVVEQWRANGGSGPNTTTVYSIDMEVLRRLNAETEVRWKEAGNDRGAKLAPRSDARGAPVTPLGVTNATGWGDTVAPKPSSEPSGNHQPARAGGADDGSLNFDLEEEQRSQPLSQNKRTAEDAIDELADIAPGWDPQQLIKDYRAWPPSKKGSERVPTFSEVGGRMDPELFTRSASFRRRGPPTAQGEVRQGLPRLA